MVRTTAASPGSATVAPGTSARPPRRTTSNGRRDGREAATPASVLRLYEALGHDLVYRYRLAPEARFEYVSRSCIAMTGYTPEDHYADPDLAFRLVHPADRRLLQAMHKGAGRNPMILRWVRRDGSILWTEHRTVVVPDEAGAPLLVEGIVRDVTDIVRANETISATQAAMRGLLEAAPTISVIVDARGRILFANDRFADLTGWTADELRGRDWAASFGAPLPPPTGPVGDPDPATGGSTVPLRLRDGRTHVIRWTTMAVGNGRGEPAPTAAMGEDLTALADQAQRRAELAAAVEHSTESIVITDTAARIVVVNAAFERATGYRSDEVLGLNPRILQSGHQSAAFYRLMWLKLSHGRAWWGQLVNRRKDGTLLIEEASVTPVTDAHGAITAYVAVKRDVTSLRKLRASLDDVHRQRAILSAALGRLVTRETIEQTCDDIAGVLIELPEAVAAGVAVFDGAGEARIVSVRSSVPMGVQHGFPLPETVSARILEHGEQGPWIEPLHRTQGGSEDAGAMEAVVPAALVVPVRHEGIVLCALLIGGSDPSGADLLPQIPAAIEIATAARALVAPHVAARHAHREVRERVSRILATKAFRTVYQPIVDLYTGRVLGFEALTRFDDTVSPVARFAEAAACGLSSELEVAAIMSAVKDAGGLPAGAILSLNVSPGLVLAGDALKRAITDGGRPITLEITEHAEVADYQALRTALTALGPGIRIAIDDAGAGTANLHHLIELRPDFVKLDISLVRGIDRDMTRQALVVGLIEFARISGRALIAVGIETELERTTLSELSVRFGQGYLLGAPAPAEAWQHVEVEGAEALVADAAGAPWDDPDPAGPWHGAEREPSAEGTARRTRGAATRLGIRAGRPRGDDPGAGTVAPWRR